MWLWWVISLLILIACIIFAWRMIVSSYEFLPADKKKFLRFNKKNYRIPVEYLPNKTNPTLQNTDQSLENTNAFYQTQFANFNERLKILEDALGQGHNSITPWTAKSTDDEEDWKELYYEENEAKEKLENELDSLRQLMEQMQSGLNNKEIEEWKVMYYAENEKKITLENELDIVVEKYNEAQSSLEKSFENIEKFSLLRGEYEQSQSSLQQMQSNANKLQQRILASAERENELENLLIEEIITREKYALLQSKYARLKAEEKDLEQKILEQSQREMNLEIRVMRLNELESKLAICEQERSKLRNQLGERFI